MDQRPKDDSEIAYGANISRPRHTKASEWHDQGRDFPKERLNPWIRDRANRSKGGGDEWRQIKRLAHAITTEFVLLTLTGLVVAIRLAQGLVNFTDFLLRRSQERHKTPKGTEKERDKMPDITLNSFPQFSSQQPDNMTPTSSTQEAAYPLEPIFRAPASMVYKLPLPFPGSEGMALFTGANVTEFLERWDDFCVDYSVGEEDRRTKLPRYCVHQVGEAMKGMDEWTLETYDYGTLRKALLKEYRQHDRHQIIYSRAFLEKFKNRPRKVEENGTLAYGRQFSRVANYLIKEGTLSPYEAGLWFVHGLPKQLGMKLFRKYNIDPIDPTTINYKKFLEFVIENAKTEDAIKELYQGQDPKSEVLEELDTIVTITGAPIQVAKPKAEEAQATKIEKSDMAITDAKMDLLTKELSQLRINMAVLATRPIATYPNLVAARPQDTRRPTVNVNAIATMGEPREQRCFYCWNEWDAAHRFRDRCGWFLDHVAKGVIHINNTGKICLGPRQEGAKEIWFQRDSSQGHQVVLATNGTDFDENIASRPENKQAAVVTEVNSLGVTFQDESDEEFAAVNASTIDRNRKKDVGWKNPAKVSKRPAIREEKDLAVPKTTRQGNYVPPTITEDHEMEVEVVDNPNMDKKRAPRVVRPKYLDILMGQTDPEDILNNLLEQTVSLKIKDILGTSQALARILGGKAPALGRKPAETFEAKIANISIETLRSYSRKTPKMFVKINDGEATKALIDTGAEVNLMTRAVAERNGLLIQTGVRVSMRVATGASYMFYGICEDVEINIGGILNHVTFFVTETGENEILLGAPFIYDTELTLGYTSEGGQYAEFKNFDKEKVGKVRLQGGSPDGNLEEDSSGNE
jgi:Aspartyl protease